MKKMILALSLLASGSAVAGIPVPLVKSLNERVQLAVAQFVPQKVVQNYELLSVGQLPAWAPKSIVTDGKKTYIEFPKGAIQLPDTPSLFAVGLKDEAQSLSYRIEGSVMTVDSVIENAMLIGQRGERIAIVRRS